ncbi:hypothetical protein EI94DRAFT_1788664 [Lactarius quietus]|nr:hypothetical protein EI94DRAFT_1788664 [Lactarius quietus]
MVLVTASGEWVKVCVPYLPFPVTTYTKIASQRSECFKVGTRLRTSSKVHTRIAVQRNTCVNQPVEAHQAAMSKQPLQTDSPPSPPDPPPQHTDRPEGLPAYSPSELARPALPALTIPVPSTSLRSASSLDSPVSVVESDDSMEYGAMERPTAYIVFGGTGANPGNRPQSGPLTRALITAAEAISASVGELTLRPTAPPPDRDMAILRSMAGLLSGLAPQTETTQDFTLTRQEILVAAEAAQRNPNVLERVKARALIEALEKARYNLAMNAAVMDEIRADVIQEAKEQMKEEQGDALSEWRTVQWESLSEAERATIRSKAEQDILQEVTSRIKQKEQEVSAEASRANTAEIEEWKQTELEGTKARLLAEAKAQVTTFVDANRESLLDEAMAELKNKVDLEAKAWGVNYRTRSSSPWRQP